MKSCAGWKDRPPFKSATMPPPPLIIAGENGAESI
jgi:hypothetical protein